ncbi:DNA integrity scanning diadenylate cyclase DisA [Paraclostridium bifermentans]|jgi:diadenylate cyclase|uniref:DNA integrity scanning protein DisA n=1 Tax=Paraclostridium bifermentans ATCC 638 = DSM 14991 TaxID=1233171 RepID=T4W0J5_PARBF|nr:DNA integrity scanning diadenylate cyclase DisA [Paraclostridium bifermentans]MDV8115798.1 DNA integrity scanning diadenylate cyclase DisA [Bacillus sp. BAU-SS-2023]RDC51100.1 DNA integrity scanning protein DisA [Acinetobacter sp. RIT592]EQK46591.1 disA bacterial checkpoint controller linker region family protein [[Clostridium] bifermentans ATCC 638] [Paraclostridium bifermentans ATCC 638 = DSM 14991]EQK48871.1 disA bacterial checkpoint controller linker region family protein [[Clostridium] 
MDDFFSGKKAIRTLKMISPGTDLRLGIDHVLKAKTGGLIVIADSDEVMSIVDGGFAINAEYSPAYLYELAKMDGAIVLSSDIKKILFANAQLIPDYSIETAETGTRHRTAERVAKQTGGIVIAISQRRNVITVYQGDKKYVVEDISKIFTKANQALQTLEKYKSVLDQAIISLNALEFKDFVTLYDVVLVVQKIEMVMRVTNIIEKYIVELGVEGTLLSMQVDELMGTTKIDQNQILKDYKRNDMNLAEFKKKIISLSSEELLDLANIAKMLGYTGFSESMDMPIRPRGYRILNKIHRLPSAIIENLVNYFEDFQDILCATIEDLDDVEGIGEIRAKYIKNGLIKMQELSLIDRHI